MLSTNKASPLSASDTLNMMAARSTQRIRVWIFPIGLMLAISIFSMFPVPQLPGIEFAYKDKLAHFAVFGLLATGLLRAAAKRMPMRAATIMAIAVTALFGLVDEVRQGLTPYRYVEFDDWLADSLGAVVAVYVYRFCKVYRHILEFRLLTIRKNSRQFESRL